MKTVFKPLYDQMNTASRLYYCEQVLNTPFQASFFFLSNLEINGVFSLNNTNTQGSVPTHANLWL